MKHRTCVMRRLRPAWRRRAGTAAALIVIAALALLTAACSSGPSSAGSGGSPNAGGSADSRIGIDYTSCIRSRGVPDYPDPDSSGALPKGSAQDFGVSSSQFQAAQQACAHLLPATDGSIQQCETTGDCPQAVVQHALSVMRKYAVLARPWGAELARPDHRFRGPSSLRCQQCRHHSPVHALAVVRVQGSRMRAPGRQARQAFPCRWGELSQ